MVPKIILAIAIFSSLGLYKGVECFEKKDIEKYNASRHYDIQSFLKFNIDQFDLHNRRCFLAFLVYTIRSLPNPNSGRRLTPTSPVLTSPKNSQRSVNDIYTFVTWLIRLLSVEFTSKFENEISIFFDLIRGWNSVMYNETKQIAVQNKARLLIKLGMQKYIWNTDKGNELNSQENCEMWCNFQMLSILLIYFDLETDIIMEHMASYNQPSYLTNKVYNDCLNTFKQIVYPTRAYDYTLGNEFKNINPEQVPMVYNFKPSKLRDFGTVLVFINTTEYNALRSNAADNKVSQYKLIVEYLKTILIQIFHSVRSIINKVVEETGSISRELNPLSINITISWEIVVVLKHLYRKATDITQDLYIFIKNHTSNIDDSELKNEYQEFDIFFQTLWEILKSRSILDNTNTPYLNRSQNRYFDSRYNYPKFIRIYSVFNESWLNNYPGDLNMTVLRVPFYEINIMLTLVKHNVYILTAAARNPNKTESTWDCGYINGCKGPSTGTLDYVLNLNPISKNEETVEFMAVIQKAKEYIRSYCKQLGVKNNVKPDIQLIIKDRGT